MKRMILAMLLCASPAHALMCFEANDVVGYSAVFHDDTATAADPTSPSATVRITPFTGTATYTAITAPAKLNATLGWFGGEYTVLASPVLGLYEIHISGVVPTGKTVGKIVEKFQVRDVCPDSSLWDIPLSGHRAAGTTGRKLGDSH